MTDRTSENYGVIKNIKTIRIHNYMDVLDATNELGFIALENHGLIENCRIVAMTDMAPEKMMPSAIGGVVVRNYAFSVVLPLGAALIPLRKILKTNPVSAMKS